MRNRSLVLGRDLLVVDGLEAGGQGRGHLIPELLVGQRSVAGDGNGVEGVGSAEVEPLRGRCVHQDQGGPDEVPGLSEADGADQDCGD